MDIINVSKEKKKHSTDLIISTDRNSKMNRLRFVLAGGGTGGHIYPAIGIAQALQRYDTEIDIVFIGGQNRLEASLVPKQGFEFLPISVEGFPRKLTWKWFRVAIKACQGLIQSLKYLRSLKPNVVIGTGGYVSGPVLFAAWLLGIPIAIQEQNVSPGLTNRILARCAKAAFLALPQDTQHFPKDIAQVTGNPIRHGITQFPRTDETYKKYNLFKTNTTIFVMGGSQGAKAINEAMIDACPLIVQAELTANSRIESDNTDDNSDNSKIRLQIIHQTGDRDVDTVKKAYEKYKIPHLVQPFFDPVEEVYSIADLMICRAGGMTISEVTACSIPAIFIPLPAAIGNNQVQNAHSVANVGAAIVIEQEEITPEILVSQLFRILTNEDLYQQMKDANRKLGKPFASDRIAESVFKLAIQDKSENTKRK